MMIAIVIISNMFVKFNRDTNKNFKTKSTCDQISNLILRQRINDYYKQNPLGPAGRVRGVVFIHKCDEVKYAFQDYDYETYPKSTDLGHSSQGEKSKGSSQIYKSPEKTKPVSPSCETEQTTYLKYRKLTDKTLSHDSYRNNHSFMEESGTHHLLERSTAFSEQGSRYSQFPAPVYPADGPRNLAQNFEGLRQRGTSTTESHMPRPKLEKTDSFQKSREHLVDVNHFSLDLHENQSIREVVSEEEEEVQEELDTPRYETQNTTQEHRQIFVETEETESSSTDIALEDDDVDHTPSLNFDRSQKINQISDQLKTSLTISESNILETSMTSKLTSRFKSDESTNKTDVMQPKCSSMKRTERADFFSTRSNTEDQTMSSEGGYRFEPAITGRFWP